MINKIYIAKTKDFTMYRDVKVLAIGESHIFVKVLYPKFWNLKPEERVIPIKEFENEYKERT
tara:strand:+ start:1168 stop:1353 length:186 start_codon:yes stop_codon:yes gene_type:complete